MANNFDSNFTNKLMRVFLEKFESARVLSKNVDTQLLSNAFNPTTGDTVFFKRPTDYTSFRNPTGDLTSSTASDIVTGKAGNLVTMEKGANASYKLTKKPSNLFPIIEFKDKIKEFTNAD